MRMSVSRSFSSAAWNLDRKQFQRTGRWLQRNRESCGSSGAIRELISTADQIVELVIRLIGLLYAPSIHFMVESLLSSHASSS
jgi:hypothetical protein